MDLASFSLDRQVINFCRLQDELVEWRNKRFESKSYCTASNTNDIDFDILYDALTRLFNQSYPDE